MQSKFIVIAGFFSVFTLVGCSDRALDTGLIGSLTGQPSPVSDNPSPIRPMSGQKETYPNLASVPPRPTDLSTEAQRQTRMDQLAKDRTAAKRRQAEAQSQPAPATLPASRLPKPAAVPPKPNLTPGRTQ